MNFKDIFSQYDWENVKQRIYSMTARDVEFALSKKGSHALLDFMALVSPAADSYLEQMAQLSHVLTQKRFGNTIQMYIPLYLSNECQNICTYCGFSYHNKIERITLTDEQILNEIKAVKSFGYDHVLLVSGEATKTAGVDYFKNAIKLIRPYFSQISLEVQPLERDEYEILADEGLYSVLVYQETYHKEKYKQYHLKGKKSNFDYRLETPDRLGEAGIHKIGLGVLLGLEDWRVDSFFCVLHLDYLRKKYWQTKFSFSLPRLRPAVGIKGTDFFIKDRELVQLICAYRIFDENVELSLSTRESDGFQKPIDKIRYHIYKCRVQNQPRWLLHSS